MKAEIFTSILLGIPWTIALTLVSFGIGAILGIPICAMRLSKFSALRFIAHLYGLVFRSIPPLLLVFIIYFGIGAGFLKIGPFQASVIGLGLVTAANMSEIYRGGVSAIHNGQWEAARALALPGYSRYLDVIYPQLLRVCLPSSAGYVIGLLKDSAIASTVGVADIAFNANQMARTTYQGLEVFAFAGVAYMVISIPIAILARIADRKMKSRIAI